MVHGIMAGLFLLASLWLVVVGLPAFWRIVNVASYCNEFLADALLVLVTLPTVFGLFLLGRFLEGPNPVRGLRASAVYLSVATIGCGLLIACGVALWSVIGIALLVAAVIMYFQPAVLAWLVRIDEQGWFHAVAFKANQGLRVRRATVIAVMVLVFCGIYTLIHHGSLETGTSWQVPAKLFPADPKEIDALRTELTALKKAREVEVAQLTKGVTLEEARERLKTNTPTTKQLNDVEERYKKVKSDWTPATDPWVVTAPFTDGKAHYIFMYHITLTLPLLLLVVAGWFAWRLVNWPTFGDFLIATEAEMNKVSWTTRRRLYQDTIVVLVTVVLLTVFLFVLDVAWIKVLTNPLIQVLKYDTQEAVRKNQSGAQW